MIPERNADPLVRLSGLREARQLLGLSAAGLSIASRVSRSLIEEAEAGGTIPQSAAKACLRTLQGLAPDTFEMRRSA